MKAFTTARASVAQRPRARSLVVCQHHAGIQRREQLGALTGVIAWTLLPSQCSAVELETFYGLATPPTSYGGYGGNKDESPKYKFLYPATWKKVTVNKVQKGTQGIDCIVQDGRNKQTRAFVVTLGRAGEDNKSFKLTDLESTFNSFSAADYDLQDAVTSADEIVSSKRESDGQAFYDYVVEGDSAVYMATITVDAGKVFALFVSVPAKQYKGTQATMSEMIQSFRIL